MSAPPKNNDALIIAYLTGQASEAEIVQFKARIGVDSDFRNQVERLESWLAPLNRDVEDVTPPEGLLESIMSDIHDQETGTPAQSMPLPIPANDTGHVQFWKRLAIAASAVAVLSLGSHWFIRTNPVQVDEQQRYMALLSGDTPSPLVAIVYDPRTGQVVARLSNVDVPDDGDLQLWLIREGAPAPVSLGLLDRTDQGRVELVIPEDLKAQTDTLALSLEAKGGSRSSGPEGPVLYTGAVSALD